jgi:hypothetical protein
VYSAADLGIAYMLAAVVLLAIIGLVSWRHLPPTTRPLARGLFWIARLLVTLCVASAAVCAVAAVGD